jgi:hypothetical protein
VFRCLFLLATVLGGSMAVEAATNEVAPVLVWRASKDRHDAAIPGWPVTRVLGRLARQTGWRVLVEPGVRSAVRVRFNGLPAREALPRLLGGLDFSLTSASNGVTTLKVFRSAASAAREEVDAERDGIREDELIVRLRKNAPGAAAEWARRLGGELVGTNGAAMRLKFDSAAEASAAKSVLESDSEVASVENNLDLFPPEVPVPASDALPAPLALQPTVNPDGSRRVIALVDSAVQPLGAEYQAFLLPAVEIVPGAAPGAEPTHGTSMAEAILRGLGAGSSDGQSTTRVRSYDVYGPNASTTTWDVAVAVTRAVQDGATIVNLSLGSGQDSPYLRDVLSSVTSQGALVVAAAGNDASAEAFYPAAYDSALAVTSSTGGNRLASFANFGGFVDVAAPGATTVSLSGNTWRVQGTSVSAAYISGVAGALGRNPSTSLLDVRQTLGTTFPVPATPRVP